MMTGIDEVSSQSLLPEQTTWPDVDFDGFKDWLYGVDNENRSINDTMKMAARLVLTAEKDKTLIYQAQQIVGGS